MVQKLKLQEKNNKYFHKCPQINRETSNNQEDSRTPQKGHISELECEDEETDGLRHKALASVSNGSGGSSNHVVVAVPRGDIMENLNSLLVDHS